MSGKTKRAAAKLVLALMLSSSAAGLISHNPAMAATQQEESDFVRAFGFSDYTYCDAKLIGANWGMTPYQGKIEIGAKIVGGFPENLAPLLQQARASGHACEWADVGLGYQDAEKLARVWGIEVWDAKARAARMYTMGNSAEVAALLQRDIGPPPMSPIDRFFASGYTYCDAKMIGVLLGQTPYEGKVEIGNKIANGLVSNIPFLLGESQRRGTACTWGDIPYDYADAERMAAAWGMNVGQAKAAAAELATFGRNDVIDAALGR